MTEATPDAPETAASPDEAPASSARFRVGAIVVIGVALALLLWLVLRDGDSSSETAPVALSASELQELTASFGHPVYWLGPRAGYTYEVERTADGVTYVRYLPPGADTGSEGSHVTVVTYPYDGAFAALQDVGAQEGSTQLAVADGGIAVASTSYPEGIHAAWPELDFQVEVFDPEPGLAREAVARGDLALVSESTPGPAPAAQQPTVMSRAELEGFAASLAQPVYWAGPRPGRSYEVEHTADGQVLVRYLPAGVEAGDDGTYLTVGTYPFAGAFAAVEALAKEPGAETITLENGGIAVVDAATPESIHLAFEGSDYQVEVFDPSAARARAIVSSGQVTTVG